VAAKWFKSKSLHPKMLKIWQYKIINIIKHTAIHLQSFAHITTALIFTFFNNSLSHNAWWCCKLQTLHYCEISSHRWRLSVSRAFNFNAARSDRITSVLVELFIINAAWNWTLTACCPVAAKFYQVSKHELQRNQLRRTVGLQVIAANRSSKRLLICKHTVRLKSWKMT